MAAWVIYHSSRRWFRQTLRVTIGACQRKLWCRNVVCKRGSSAFSLAMTSQRATLGLANEHYGTKTLQLDSVCQILMVLKSPKTEKVPEAKAQQESPFSFGRDSSGCACDCKLNGLFMIVLVCINCSLFFLPGAISHHEDSVFHLFGQVVHNSPCEC